MVAGVSQKRLERGGEESLCGGWRGDAAGLEDLSDRQRAAELPGET
jgi:hypothetical protein